MNPIRILAIAPYVGLQQTLLQAVQSRRDIELTVYVGDLEKGVEIMRNLNSEPFDLVMSRGGTAALLRDVTSLPVVEIGISAYDILRAIQLAQACSKKYAIIGYQAITSRAKELCALSNITVPILTIDQQTDVHQTLQNLKLSGIDLVLCDMISSAEAEQIGMDAMLLVSGLESVNESLDAAVLLYRSSSQINTRSSIFRSILEHAPYHTFAYRDEHLLYSFSPSASAGTDELAAFISRHLDKLFPPAGPQNLECKWNQSILRLKADSIHTALGVLQLVYADISPSNPFFDEKGIIVYNRYNELEAESAGHFRDLTLDPKTWCLIQTYASSPRPIMITGEPGTAKNLAAEYLYKKGPFNQAPFYIIDCALMNVRLWQRLLNHSDSPFHRSGLTIFLKNAAMLTGQQSSGIIALLYHSKLSSRNRLIFSFGADERANAHPVLTHIRQNQMCLILNMPAMRAHRSDIPAFANLSLADLNQRLGKQLVGFEPEAMSLLQAYSWPRNFDQFHRVLQELAITSTTRYIKSKELQSILQHESPYQSALPQKGHAVIDLQKPLSEIEYDIIQLVLAQDGMTHAGAAESLGISRSTIWRILKNGQSAPQAR